MYIYINKYRILIFFILFILAYLISYPVTLGMKKEDWNKKLCFWRRKLVDLIYILIRIALLVFGFWWIPIHYENNDKNGKNNKKMARIVISNHNTCFDGLLLPWLTHGTFAAKIELSKTPMIGRIATVMQAMWIDRNNKDSRNVAIEAIIKHANNEDLPPLCIFPQGTTSRIGTLTSFKIGAFLPKKTIQIIGLDWNYNDFDLSFADFNMLVNVYIASCQLVNFVDVKVFKPYTPNQDEINNPSVFADNVRNLLVNNMPGIYIFILYITYRVFVI